MYIDCLLCARFRARAWDPDMSMTSSLLIIGLRINILQICSSFGQQLTISVSIYFEISGCTPIFLYFSLKFVILKFNIFGFQSQLLISDTL